MQAGAFPDDRLHINIALGMCIVHALARLAQLALDEAELVAFKQEVDATYDAVGHIEG